MVESIPLKLDLSLKQMQSIPKTFPYNFTKLETATVQKLDFKISSEWKLSQKKTAILFRKNSIILAVTTWLIIKIVVQRMKFFCNFRSQTIKYCFHLRRYTKKILKVSDCVVISNNFEIEKIKRNTLVTNSS